MMQGRGRIYRLAGYIGLGLITLRDVQVRYGLIIVGNFSCFFGRRRRRVHAGEEGSVVAGQISYVAPISGAGVHDGLDVLLLSVFAHLAVPSGYLPDLHVSMVAHNHGESALRCGSRVGHVLVLKKLRHIFGLVSHLKIGHAMHGRNIDTFANIFEGLAEVMKQITDLGKPVGARFGRG